jgi:hypothetical protein
VSPGSSDAPRLGTEGARTADETPGEGLEDDATRLLPVQHARHAARVRGGFAVVVETPDHKYRRRLYLSLSAAEKAAKRAEAAGYTAEVVLCRLEPVAVVR